MNPLRLIQRVEKAKREIELLRKGFAELETEQQVCEFGCLLMAGIYQDNLAEGSRKWKNDS